MEKKTQEAELQSFWIASNLRSVNVCSDGQESNLQVTGLELTMPTKVFLEYFFQKQGERKNCNQTQLSTKRGDQKTREDSDGHTWHKREIMTFCKKYK